VIGHRLHCKNPNFGDGVTRETTELSSLLDGAGCSPKNHALTARRRRSNRGKEAENRFQFSLIESF